MTKRVEALEQGASIEDLVKLPVREQIGRFKYVAGGEYHRPNMRPFRRALCQTRSTQLLQKEDF